MWVTVLEEVVFTWRPHWYVRGLVLSLGVERVEPLGNGAQLEAIAGPFYLSGFQPDRIRYEIPP